MHVLVNMWFSPSGQVIPLLTVNSFPAEPYQHMSNIAGDLIWFVLWLYLLMWCIVGLVHAVFFRRVTQYLTNVWTWVDWLSMLGGFLTLIGWVVFLVSLQSIKGAAMDAAMEQPRAEDGWAFVSDSQQALYMNAAARIHAEASGLASFLMSYRVFICWYTIFLILRFFQAFEAQPRMAVVTDTIARSSVDIAHFLAILCAVFLSYAVAGMLLFGHRLLEFSEWYIAVHQCFLIMLGDFDYYTLAGEHPLIARFWFMTFVTSVSVILLNMALAIIMDVYIEVCRDADGSAEVWTQAAQALDSTCRRRTWLSYRKIEEVVSQLPDAPISQDSLLAEIPEMSTAQAQQLIEEVESRQEREDNKGLSLSDAFKLLASTTDRVKAIARQVDALASTEEEEKMYLNSLSMHIPDSSGHRRPIKLVGFDDDTDHRLQMVEKRISLLEDQIHETMKAAVVGSRDMRNVLTVVEHLSAGEAEGAAA
mmetsp:Transcript_137061/g.382168  ORF Transcript_137061/g.382168 Transcript_137061/m.382168 type:complete len:477 (+) Transcript_137061:1-1431(+)